MERAGRSRAYWNVQREYWTWLSQRRSHAPHVLNGTGEKPPASSYQPAQGTLNTCGDRPYSWSSVSGLSPRLTTSDMKPPLLLVVLVLVAQASHAATVYRWVDESGVIHITSEKPPASVRAEKLDLPTAKPGSGASAKSGATHTKSPTASPAQVAERAEVLNSLKNRECVLALEELDRRRASEPTSAGVAPSAANRRRNCSTNPTVRSEQRPWRFSCGCRTARPARRRVPS
jgi:hypothetical protein